MRTARIKVAGGVGYYHCLSRIIERQFRLGDGEKEHFRKLLRQVEAFSGVRVLTYAIMSNHFHLLVEVPERQAVGDEEFLSRLGQIYPRFVVAQVAGWLKGYREQGAERAAEELKARYTYRMYDVSEFMKTLKQKFTQWYNRRNGRRGTLWEERFKSIMLEPLRPAVTTARQGASEVDGEQRDNALLTMAAYIDLNAVRAGVVGDPKDYRYCGYGEAVGGDALAREGLAMLYGGYVGQPTTWQAIAAAYRLQLFERGAEVTALAGQTVGRKGVAKAKVQEVLDAGGKLPRAALLRCRVRYFADGVVLGSRQFVEEVFQRHRDQFGAKRKTGARPLRHGDWGDLCSMRALRLAAVTAPGQDRPGRAAVTAPAPATG